MIKFIIFDLDGVLVDTKKIHYTSLNKALLSSNKKYQISYADHSRIYDGLSTFEKLNILLKKNFIKRDEIKKISKLKQIYTKKYLKKEVKFDKKKYNLFQKLNKNFKIAIATNSILSTLKICLKILKIAKFLEFSLATNSLKFTKPHPEIYLKCLLKTGFLPRETMIVEDSHNGRLAALEAGCNLMPVDNLKDVNYKNIILNIKNHSMKHKKFSWVDKKMNILIPMAGAGSRFETAGFTFPKPLIEIYQKPMIEWVLNSLNIDANYIFIIRKEHQVKFNISSLLRVLKPNCKIIELDEITQGAACTTLLAKKYINNSDKLIIANSDQFFEWNSSRSLYSFINKNVDGGILVFEANHPKWSYAETDENGIVIRVAEKEVISKYATVGVYYWKNGSVYIKYAEKMIEKNVRVKNEFYVCPVYNEAIADKKKITIEKIDKMWGLGTPEDLNYFLNNYKK